VAIVTGASRGLGLLLAGELARQGCRLVICARDAAELDRAAAQLREAGADVTAVACDVTDEATPSRLVETALERYGRLDIVLSNAGIIQVGPAQEASPELFEIALDTMALAPARLAYPHPCGSVHRQHPPGTGRPRASNGGPRSC
jgi:NAD(P)-dependent dehydrogenase (short-subunit alcohol dehydrogenase family)